MNLLVLYLVLLKATLSTFSGMTSLPVLRDELVVKQQWLTDEQLNTAVVVGRSTPGPAGLHVVGCGYFAAGIPGAIIGFFALITPALLAMPLVWFVRRGQQQARLQSALSAIVVASVGLVTGTAWQLSESALDSPLTWLLATVTTVVLLTTRWDPVWVMAGAAALALLAGSLS